MAALISRLFLILVAAIGPSAAFAAQRTYERQLNAPTGGRLTFSTDVGSVAVVGHDAPDVVIHAKLHGAQSFLARFHISVERTSSGVRISAHTAHRDWFDWFQFTPDRVRFVLEVPRDYPIDLHTSGGNLDVQGLSAPVRGMTEGGGIIVRNVAGAINMHTSGGSIKAHGLEGPTKLTTSGGGIDVSDSLGDLDLRTSGGDIRIKNQDGMVYARTSGGSIRAELSGNRGVTLTTSGGGITLLLPQNTRASIEAQSSGGGVTSDFSLSTVQLSTGNHLLGTIGGGGPPIHLHTSGGGIHLAREK